MSKNREDILPKYESVLRDESGLSGNAEAVVFPSDIEELSLVMREASGSRISRTDGDRTPVTIQGGLTGINGGSVPDGGLIVNLSKLDKIEKVCRSCSENEQEDDVLSITVGAGTRLDQIEDYLRNNIQLTGGLCFFPPNPTEKTASIGGLFASNGAGPNKIRYGNIADNVIGLTWVTSSGEVWEIERGKYIFTADSILLPNDKLLEVDTGLKMLSSFPNAPHEGEDLIDFLAGSEGFLGVAAELRLRILPMPDTVWGILFCFGKDTRPIDFVNNVKEDLRLTACEFFDEESLRILSENAGGNSLLDRMPSLPEDSYAAVYIEVISISDFAAEEAMEKLFSAFIEAGGHDENTRAASGLSGVKSYRDMRHALPEIIGTKLIARRRQYADATRVFTEFTGPSDRNGEYLKMYRSDIDESGSKTKSGLPLAACIYGHIWENHLLVDFLPEDEDELKICNQLIRKWAAKVVSDGGLLVSENGVGRLKKELLSEFLPAANKEQFLRIQELFQY